MRCTDSTLASRRPALRKEIAPTALGRRPSRVGVTAVLASTLVLLMSGCVEAEQAGPAPTSEGSDPGVAGAGSPEPSPDAGPSDDFVRFVTVEDAAEVWVECIRSEGFPVTLLPGNGVGYQDVPPAQGAAATAAGDLCSRRFPIDPLYLEPFNAAQLDFLYDFYVEESVPCLEGLGFTGFDPPAQATFAATYGGQETWTPFSDITEEQITLTGIGIEEAEQTCPQVPPSDELYSAELLKP